MQHKALADAKKLFATNQPVDINSLLLNDVPNPIFNEILQEAANHQQWQVVQAMSDGIGTNTPSIEVIDKALDKALIYKHLETFKWLCDKARITQPSQKKLETLLCMAHGTQPADWYRGPWTPRWDFVVYICGLETANKPGTLAISNALQAAATYKQWELVQQIGRMKGNNKPTFHAIDHALERALAFNDLEMFRWLCGDECITKPSQGTLEALLHTICQQQYPQWDFVKHICSLDTVRPDALNGTLERAAAHHNLEVVQQIGRMKGNNKPTAMGMDNALKRAFEFNNLAMFKWLCGDECITKPSQGKLEALLHTACQKHHPQWDFITHICGLNSANKPSIRAIGEVLKIAALHQQWPLVKNIYRMNSDNRPGQSSIGEALATAAQYNQLDIVKELCELPYNSCPSAQQVGKALEVAAQHNHVEIITYFATLQAENQPLPQAYVEALKHAAAAGHENAVQYFCKLENGHQPRPQHIALALNEAVAHDCLYVVTFLLSAANPVQPTAKDIVQAFLKALHDVNPSVRVIKYFIELNDQIKRSRTALNDALLSTIGRNFDNEIITCLIENHQRSPLFSNATLKQAIALAAEKKREEIVALLTAVPLLADEQEPLFDDVDPMDIDGPMDSVSQEVDGEGIANALSHAVETANLNAVKNICATISKGNLQEDVINNALQQAQQHAQSDITHYLLNAQKLLKLYQQIDAFKAYGHTLQEGDETSKHCGEKTVALANTLKSRADDYTIAYFGDKPLNDAKQSFTTALQDGFEEMKEHRAAWKIYLANIALAATVVGVLINYLATGHAFFSNTKRQNMVETLSNDLQAIEEVPPQNPNRSI